MSLKAYRRLRVLAAAAMLAACAPQTEIVKLYDAGGTDNRPYERLLVVAITADSDSRRQLEDMISTQLQQAGVASVSAHTRTGAKTVLKQQEVNEAARESGADAILISCGGLITLDILAPVEQRTGLPAISVPCGFTPEGLPVGMQIVGRHNAEFSVLQLAYAFEQATEFWKQHPKVARG